MFRGRFGQRRWAPFSPFGSVFRGPFGLFGVSNGPAHDLYRRRGVVGRLIDRIPPPLKAFGAVAGLAAVTVVTAPAILILAGPPLICGAWLLRSRQKKLQSVLDELHDQRWKNMASFHLQHPTNAGFDATLRSQGSELGSHQIPVFARIAVENAVRNNEQQLAAKLHIREARDLEFGELSLLSQDFKMGTSGMSEQMLVSEYPMYINHAPTGIVRVAVRGDASTQKSRARVEVQARDGTLFVLNSPSPSNSVIEGHGHRIN